MPLIMITGLPSSGKSRTAQEIYEHFKANLQRENSPRQVKIVSDSDTLDWDGRDVIYMSIPKEKELRSWLKSETQRYLNLNQIVILDAANYIKGFRYELFCISKEAKTQYCVVEKFIDTETCWRWNQQSIARLGSADEPEHPDCPSPGYARETFDALLLRYERCDESNRWDSPLFRITAADERLDLDKIYNIIINEDPLAPNKCTSISSSSTTIFKPTN